MSFLKRLMQKLFGKKEEEVKTEPPRIPYTPTIPTTPVTPTPTEPVTIPVGVALPPLQPTPPVTATEWPIGSYEFPQPGSGAWYVPVKLPGRGWEQAGPFKSVAEFDKWVEDVLQRDKNMRESDRLGLWKQNGRGSIPVTELSVDDLCYLWKCHHDYRLKVQNGDLFRTVLSGSHDDISRAIQTADINNPSMGPWPIDTVNPKLVSAVVNAFK